MLDTDPGAFGPVVAAGTVHVGSRPGGLAAAEVNGDGRPAPLTATYFSSTVGVLLNPGPYTPLAATTGLDAAAVAFYPNPTHGRVQVAVPAVAGATAVQATLLDALGRVARQQAAALSAAGTILPADADGLAPGVCVLRLPAGPSVVARRVVLHSSVPPAPTAYPTHTSTGATLLTK